MALYKDPSLRNYVLSFLLKAPNGKALISHLLTWDGEYKRTFPKYKISTVSELHAFLLQHPRSFVLRDSEHGPTVSAKTDLFLCPRHSNKAGSCEDERCNGLHICVFDLLSGKCRHGERCYFGHDLDTLHNLRVLQDNMVGNLNIRELRTLLALPASRTGVTQPRVCRYYNCKLGCAKGLKCYSFHVCKCYVLKRCKFAARCKRNHDMFDKQVKNVLMLYGVSDSRSPKDILDELYQYEIADDDLDNGDTSDNYENNERHKSLLMMGQAGSSRKKQFGSMPNIQNLWMGTAHQTSVYSVQPTARHTNISPYGTMQRHSSGTVHPPSTKQRIKSASESKEVDSTVAAICVYFRMGKCAFGDHCKNLHINSNFLWQLAPLNGDSISAVWTGFAEEISFDLETQYSQPDTSGCHVLHEGKELKVRFSRMIAKDAASQIFSIRRLSTPSTMDPAMRVNKRKYEVATTWLWFWRDREEPKEWHEFGIEHPGLAISIPSNMIELVFLQKNDATMTIDTYSLNFRKMRLKDEDTDVSYKVKRRPEAPKSLEFPSREPIDNVRHNSCLHKPSAEWQQSREATFYAGLTDDEACHRSYDIPAPDKYWTQSSEQTSEIENTQNTEESESTEETEETSGTEETEEAEETSGNEETEETEEKMYQFRQPYASESRNKPFNAQNVPFYLPALHNTGVSGLDPAEFRQFSEHIKFKLKPEEYEEVKRRFTQTLGKSSTVTSILGIHNEARLEMFSKAKRQLTAGPLRVVQRMLYYGLSAHETVDAICDHGIKFTDGFPASRKGKVKRGGYFFASASKADRANGRVRERSVFVVDCLLGTQDVNGRAVEDFCDVDDHENPKIFKIFNNSLVHLKYLITYRCA